MDLGNNTITIQGNGTIRTITVTNHLGGEVRKPKVLLCYDCQNGITNEDIIFATKPDFFLIGIINLPNTIQFVKTTNVEVIDVSVKTSNL